MSDVEVPWINPTLKRELEALIATARAEKKWLYCYYQNLWFSPRQLEQANSQGSFRWGIVNFQLRDPAERVAAAKRRMEEALAEYQRIEQEWIAEGR